MTLTSMTAPPPDLAIRWRNVRVLAVCQALFVSAMSINLTLTGLVGYTLVENKAYATLPFSLITVAAALTTIFAALWMQRIGRRLGFAAGALVCTLGGIISIGAILRGDFTLFCVGTACMGVFQAFAQYYRLAAADGVSLDRKSKAISLVMTGGVVAAVLGPLVAQWSRGAVPGNAFAGAYAVVTLLGLLSVLLLMWQYQDPQRSSRAPVSCPENTGAVQQAPARPMREILRQPIFMAALLNNLVGYAVMMFIMTATPLAMIHCQYSVDDSVGVIQWHLVAMYAPSFVTGWLIQRCGVALVLLMGSALCALCVALAGMASTLVFFYAALLCLGLGWNFMFVGGTTLLTRAYRPAEQGKAQACSEFSTFAITALASLCAGPLLIRLGWASMNVAVLPLLALATAATLTWAWQERRMPLALA